MENDMDLGLIQMKMVINTKESIKMVYQMEEFKRFFLQQVLLSIVSTKMIREMGFHNFINLINL